MVIIFWITSVVILIYLAYPVWLLVFSSGQPETGKETGEIQSVSLILLSYNGKQFLKDKINFLLKELSHFQHYELIIIDDNSTDGSKEILNNFKNIGKVTIINKKEQRGIPHSMNIGVNIAKYNAIIFCDQRQELSGNVLQQIVEPLVNTEVGAVSGQISHLDKANCISVVRKHENFLKSIESKIGKLVGVYGPLYAIKKDCYSDIPEHIILDDLYLSLRILKTKRVVMRKDCQIIDNNFSLLYDYKRTKRYLTGFLQILKDKTLIRDLNPKQKVMLIWHKYFRLSIPFFLFLSYVSTGMMVTQGAEYIVIFSLLTILGFVALFPNIFKIQFRMKNFVRMNILYMIAFSDIFINDIILQK